MMNDDYHHPHWKRLPTCQPQFVVPQWQHTFNSFQHQIHETADGIAKSVLLQSDSITSFACLGKCLTISCIPFLFLSFFKNKTSKFDFNMEHMVTCSSSAISDLR